MARTACICQRYVPSFRSTSHPGSAPEGALVMTVLKWVERSLDTRIGVASRVEQSSRAGDDLSWWSWVFVEEEGGQEHRTFFKRPVVLARKAQQAAKRSAANRHLSRILHQEHPTQLLPIAQPPPPPPSKLSPTFSSSSDTLSSPPRPSPFRIPRARTLAAVPPVEAAVALAWPSCSRRRAAGAISHPLAPLFHDNRKPNG